MWSKSRYMPCSHSIAQNPFSDTRAKKSGSFLDISGWHPLFSGQGCRFLIAGLYCTVVYVVTCLGWQGPMRHWPNLWLDLRDVEVHSSQQLYRGWCAWVEKASSCDSPGFARSVGVWDRPHSPRSCVAARHAAFLLTRSRVGKDGKTANEWTYARSWYGERIKMEAEMT